MANSAMLTIDLKFRTEIKLKSQQQNLLDYQSKVLLLGSCFSENIGEKLAYYKFNTCVNPFGVLFSPTAIEKVLHDTVVNKQYTTNHIVKNGELFHSLHHHSKLSALDAHTVVKNIENAQQKCVDFLQNASHVIITLGTSWVYKYLVTNKLVANCHKIPQTEFRKEILSVNNVCVAVQNIISLIKKVNPSTQIIFTVSPVRHTKEGLVENSLSKANLLSALGQIKEEQVSYFGSYEIMLDDLRDYRFYEADLIHPNKMAIDYIWEQFSKSWIDENAQRYFKRIATIQQGLLHKPFHMATKSHQEFLKNLAVKKQNLETELNVKF